MIFFPLVFFSRTGYDGLKINDTTKEEDRMFRGIPYTKVTGAFDLTGKVAIVIGGAGGIGEATARM